MEAHPLPHMNGGEAKASYAENSLFQKIGIQKAKDAVEDSISELCKSNLPEKCISIADLGCSSGPNALFTIQEILHSIAKACRELDRKPPSSAQYFLNDLVVNDFNALFKLLPGFREELEKLQEKWNSSTISCFVAAMPGSFYSRLFPDHSIHFVHSSYSLHWLSQVPRGLLTTSGEPLNQRNICLAKTSPVTVHEAYLDQFKRDFSIFLKLRYQEMATSGQLTLTFVCKNVESDGYDICESVGMAIDDMVKEGQIQESKLATFNLPYYAASTEEIRQVIENEGSFRIRRLHTFTLPWDANMEDRKAENKLNREEHLAMFTRSALEPMLANHFGESIMDDLFNRFGKQAAKYMQIGNGIITSIVISLSKQ